MQVKFGLHTIFLNLMVIKLNTNFVLSKSYNFFKCLLIPLLSHLPLGLSVWVSSLTVVFPSRHINNITWSAHLHLHNNNPFVPHLFSTAIPVNALVTSHPVYCRFSSPVFLMNLSINCSWFRIQLLTLYPKPESLNT